jgi:hypothetical protein
MILLVASDCGGEIQLHTRQQEQFTLEVACEHRVPIANDRSRDPVEANAVVEEASGDEGCCVRVSQRQKVRGLGESVDHRKNDRLSIDVRQSFHEIHGHIGPNCRRDTQRLQQLCRVEVLRLVLLAHHAGPHELLHQSARTRHMEVSAEAV